LAVEDGPTKLMNKDNGQRRSIGLPKRLFEPQKEAGKGGRGGRGELRGRGQEEESVKIQPGNYGGVSF
jgi:hypothetical protein